MKHLQEATARPVRVLGKSFMLSGYESDGYYNHITQDDMPDVDILALAYFLLPENGVALDVGANLGYETLFFSSLAQKGAVYAFEPVPSNVELITYNLKQNSVKNVTVMPFGLGRKASKTQVAYQEQNRGGASISGSGDAKNAELYDVSESIDIKVLDELHSTKQLPLKRCDLLKVDIEGFELEFLAGARKFIAAYRPAMIIEANHWCLDGLHNITMAEFLDTIEDIYPFVAAFDGNRWIDVRKERLRFMHDNMVFRRFQNLFCDFDQKRWEQTIAQHQWGWTRLGDFNFATKEVSRLTQRVAELESVVEGLEEKRAEYERVMNNKAIKAVRKARQTFRRSKKSSLGDGFEAR